MKKILLKFFADTNLGDDLMVRLLLRRFPGWDFYAFSRRPEHLVQFHHYRNFHVLCRGYFSAAVGREKFDAYILVGGSVLNYSCLSDLCYQLKEILICAVLRVRSVPSMVVGANVTMPLRSRHFWAAKLLLSLRLRLLDLTTVRDSLSYRIMAPLSPGRVRCYPDLVFGYPLLIHPVRSEAVKTLGISVLGNLSGGAQAGLVEKLAELSNLFLRSGDKTVLLFAFDTGLGGDREAAFQVRRKIEKQERVEIISYDGDTGAFLAHLSRCGALLPIRFHACILGLMMGIPLLPLIYAVKTENLLRDLRYPGTVLHLSDLGTADPDRLVRELEEGAAGAFRLGGEQLRVLSENSMEHLNQVKKQLGRTADCQICGRSDTSA